MIEVIIFGVIGSQVKSTTKNPDYEGLLFPLSASKHPSS
jgi:hypothetical protein